MHSISENSSDRYIFDVDLEYLNELHELHNDYPLALEKREISHNMLSNYFSSIANKYEIYQTKTEAVNKLISNLGNKSKYSLHYRNLQLYLSPEIKLVSVHRIYIFKQSVWLKKYIDFNTNKRNNAGNSFEKDVFKLMNNSTFVKKMGNL